MTRLHDVKERLHAATVDPTELLCVLWTHFPVSISQDPRQLSLSRAGEPTALVINRTAKGEISSVLPTERVTNEEIDELGGLVEDACLRVADTLISRCLLMSSQPITGYLRIGEHLQLLPVPGSAPQRPPEGGDYPVILEVAIKGSSNETIVAFRQHTALLRGWLLLNALLSTHLSRIDRRGGSVAWARRPWIIRPSADGFAFQDGVARVVENHWEAYSYPEFEPRGNSFYSHGALQPMPHLPPKKYFTMFGASEQVGAIPSNIDTLVDAFYSLSDDDKHRFERAAYWYEFAQTMKTYSFSAAFVGYVLGIDALVPPAGNVVRCDSCGRDAGPGATARFKAFLEQTVPEVSAASVAAARLYGVRSALVHGGALFMADLTYNPLIPEWRPQSIEYGTVAWLTQLALVNWLSDRGNDSQIAGEMPSVAS